MSESHLDENLAGWPTDPYELLRVPRDVSARDLRRAYTRLIKVYKPEQAPEQFRRIREAYETVLRYVEFFGRWTTEAKSPIEAPVSSPAESESDSRSQEPSAGGSSLPQTQSLEEELRELWELVCRADNAVAYGRGLRLHEIHPGHEDLCARMYWLLTLYPKLDSERSPCDWLFEGMRACGLTNRLRQLYGREVAADAREALGSRSSQLIRVCRRPAQVLTVAQWRWQAAATLQQWSIIPADLDFLQGTAIFDDRKSWVGLLVMAVDHLAWARQEVGLECLEGCVREIHQLTRDDRSLDDALDRLDFLLELSDDWHSLKDRGVEIPELTELIPLSWVRPFEDVRPALMALLTKVHERPHDALVRLESLQSRSGAVLAQLGRVLNDAAHDAGLEERSDSAELAQQVRDFLDSRHWFTYTDIQRPLFEFCLREMIGPEQLARLIDDIPAYQLTTDLHLAHRLRSDWPLRCVCLAHRLFWV